MISSHTREVIGYFCRWSLLGGVGATIALVVWASLSATAAVPSDVAAELVMVDSIAAPAEQHAVRLTVGGFIKPLHVRSGIAAGLLIVQGQPVRNLRMTGEGRCQVLLDDPPAGTTRAMARGLPYGATAFQAQPVSVSIIDRSRAVFLIDARLALRALEGQGDRWRAAFRRMQALGEAVLFHLGTRAEYSRVRAVLASAGSTALVLYDDSAPVGDRLVRRASRSLGRRDMRGTIQVVTGDAELARQLARQEFSVHLIEPEIAPRVSMPVGGLRRHASVAKFKDFLSP